jgi:hypothetical protein
MNEEFLVSMSHHLVLNMSLPRIVTGPDTGESTRLDTRPTTRPGGGNVPGAGVSAGPSAGLSTGKFITGGIRTRLVSDIMLFPDVLHV